MLNQNHKSNLTTLVTKSVKWISLFVVSLVAIAPVLSQSDSLSIGRNFRPDPIKLEGVAGGSVSVASLAGIEAKCRGFSGSQPNHVINLNSNFPSLDILAYTGNVTDDLTMLIKGSNGLVLCADDEYRGRYPQLTRRLPQGSYQIWIGVSEANKSIKYTMSLSEIQQK
jgi:hypothetical protein